MMSVLGWLLAGILVACTIGLHYEIMRLVSDWVLPYAVKRFHDRRAMMTMIITLMLGHIAEIWIFALAMMAVHTNPGWGSLSGDFDGGLDDFVYFSAVSYTSIGFGDISPRGFMRAISASEALTGLMMIAWSASFTYLKMEQIWNRRHSKSD